MTLADSTRLHIIATCMACKWNLAAACRSLGIVSKTLYNRLHEYERAGFVVHEGKRWRATRAGMELVRWYPQDEVMNTDTKRGE